MISIDWKNYQVSELLPHNEPMILIDELMDLDNQQAVCKVDMSKPSVFSQADGSVPSYVGIEYMVQAVGIYIGAINISKGNNVQVGFILGTRHYQCEQATFAANTDLTVIGRSHLFDDELGIFDCEIHTDRCIAKAQIKAIQPKQISDFL